MEVLVVTGNVLFNEPSSRVSIIDSDLLYAYRLPYATFLSCVLILVERHQLSLGKEKGANKRQTWHKLLNELD